MTDNPDLKYRGTLVVQYAQGWIGTYPMPTPATLNQWQLAIDDTYAELREEEGRRAVRVVTTSPTPHSPRTAMRPTPVVINLRHVASVRFDIDPEPVS